MDDSSPRELELTPDLIEYAKAVAIKEAEKRCPNYVVYDDVVQEVLLHLISKPPKYDPTRGASEKTLIYTIVQRAVLKYIGRQYRHAKRFTQAVEQEPEASDEPEGKLLGPRAGTTAARERMIGVMDAEDTDDASPQRDSAAERRPSDLTTKSLTTDDVLEFIDSEESRELCRLFMQCKCSFTETARRLGVVEGTVRYRLKLLEPKLIAAGFHPITGRDTHDDDN